MKFLDRHEVAERLPSALDQIELAGRAYAALARGDVEMPPKIGIHTRPNAFIHAMPAFVRGEDVAVIKWVSGYPENPAQGLPYISGLIIVNDAGTGEPLAVLDAREITAARTAAASGLCVRLFAPQGWSRAAILGAGEQGRYHAAMLRALNPECEIVAFDLVADRAAALVEGVVVAPSPEAAVRGADIVVTAGPIVENPRPLIVPAWLHPGALVLPIDFDFYTTRETVAAARLFLTDDVEQFDYYRKAGHFAGWPEPHGTVGEHVLVGGLPETADSPDLPVVCCNLGVAVLDAFFAAHVLGRGP